MSELVEVVVETEAEVGASGYSVVGGGEQGIFIKEVLKDSRAAKHLSLQKGTKGLYFTLQSAMSNTVHCKDLSHCPSRDKQEKQL